MDVTMPESNVEDDEMRQEHGPNGSSRMRMKLEDMELSQRAQELAEKARDWISKNPFAALGIAVAAGFLAGRVARTWALRL